MNIGIDIDGVLIDIGRMIIDCGTKMCVNENLPIEIDISAYDEKKIFNWSEEQAEKFWNEYLVRYVIKSKPREFAVEIIRKLKKQGNKIYFITSRDDYGMPQEYLGKMQDLTRRWFKKYHVDYDRLIFVQDKEKISQCLENGVNVMIEDNPNNIQYMSKKIKVIKFDCQYNKHINNENVITAYSWYHIYEIIEGMRGK